MSNLRAFAAAALVASADLVVGPSAANADLVLSQLVVELTPGDHARSDIEMWNNGKSEIYVAVDPREILAPGTVSQTSRNDPDPEKLGLLVSPARLVLEPGQRRLLRIASIAPSDRERIYRVTVRPVVGKLTSQISGLKVLVGYDMLVIVRPSELRPHVSGSRVGDVLTLKNDGNVSVELVAGRACEQSRKICEDLPDTRLYAGAEKTVKLSADRRAEYKVKVGTKLLAVQF